MPPQRKPVPKDRPALATFIDVLDDLVQSTQLSVAELAVQVGVSRPTLYRILNGSSRAHFEKLLELLDRIGGLSCWSRDRVRFTVQFLTDLAVAAADEEPRRKAKPKNKPVTITAPKEQIAFAERFAAYLDTLRERGVELGDLYCGEAWLRRYASGENLPGAGALTDLHRSLLDLGINDAKQIAELDAQARTAFRARTEARRFQRVLQGGSP